MAADESQDYKIQTFVDLSEGAMVCHYRIVAKICAGEIGVIYHTDNKIGSKTREK